MKDVTFINLGNLSSYKLTCTNGKIVICLLELELFIGRLLATGETPGLPNLSNLIETKKHDVQTGLKKNKRNKITVALTITTTTVTTISFTKPRR